MVQYSSLTINIIIFAGVITGLSLFYQGVTDRYSLTGSTSDFSTINSTTRIEEKAQSIQAEITSITRDFAITDIFDLATLFVFKVSGLLLEMGNVLLSSVNAVPRFFTSIPIPTWFTSMLLVIALVVLIFSIISMATRKDI